MLTQEERSAAGSHEAEQKVGDKSEIQDSRGIPGSDKVSWLFMYII